MTETTVEDGAVLALCEQWGFGAVMSSAARQWKERDPVGALTVGPCVGSDALWLKVYRKHLGNGAPELEAIDRADQAQISRNRKNARGEA